MRIWLIVISVMVFVLFVGFGYQLVPKQKQVFVYTNTVFEKFEGTLHLQQKLQKERLAHQAYLDSLNSLIRAGRKELGTLYENQKDYFAVKEQQTNDQYTNDLWKYINDSIKEYGDENGFDFVFGASGDGSLMYANQSLDKTDAVIDYVNSKYNAGPAVKDSN